MPSQYRTVIKKAGVPLPDKWNIKAYDEATIFYVDQDGEIGFEHFPSIENARRFCKKWESITLIIHFWLNRQKSQDRGPFKINEGYYVLNSDFKDIFSKPHSLNPQCNFHEHFGQHVDSVEELGKVLSENQQNAAIILLNKKAFRILKYGNWITQDDCICSEEFSSQPEQSKNTLFPALGNRGTTGIAGAPVGTLKITNEKKLDGMFGFKLEKMQERFQRFLLAKTQYANAEVYVVNVFDERWDCIKPGDVILSVNNMEVNMANFRSTYQKALGQGRVYIKYLRRMQDGNLVETTKFMQ